MEIIELTSNLAITKIFDIMLGFYLLNILLGYSAAPKIPSSTFPDIPLPASPDPDQ